MRWYGFWIALLMSLLPMRGLCFESDTVVLITAREVISLEVQVASTPEEWQAGLRSREAMPPESGMLFVFPRESIRSFSARGLSFAIDVILINAFGRVVGVFEAIEGVKAHASPFPILGALEVPAGFCRNHGVSAGDTVRPMGFAWRPRDQAGRPEEDRTRIEKRLVKNVEENPDDEAAWEELALFQVASGKHTEALEIFKRLLDKDRTAQRLNGMGVALAGMGRHWEAEACFLEAVGRDPEFAPACNNLIRIYRRAGRLEKAAMVFKDAVERHPASLTPRLALSRVYVESGDLEAAYRLLEGQSAQGEEPAALARRMGDIHLRRGEFEKAAEAYLRFLRIRPYDAHARDLKAFVLVHGARDGGAGE